ncbi:hypothetical protein RDI58_017877 [Solanum bulbocastanum]|uniref:Uncharacterized protein n=1 Tax=Solanum bulbocastanum TaxID=147425 RepID=A0AAN8Y9L3_SOLBU
MPLLCYTQNLLFHRFFVCFFSSFDTRSKAFGLENVLIGSNDDDVIKRRPAQQTKKEVHFNNHTVSGSYPLFGFFMFTTRWHLQGHLSLCISFSLLNSKMREILHI